MVVITKVEFIEVPNNPTPINSVGDIPIMDNSYNSPYVHPDITVELVTGEKFTDINGKVIELGMTDEVSSVLGEPFNVLRTLREENYILQDRISSCIRDLDGCKSRNMKLEEYNSTMNVSYAQLEDEYHELESDSVRISGMTFFDKIKLIFKK